MIKLTKIEAKLAENCLLPWRNNTWDRAYYTKLHNYTNCACDHKQHHLLYSFAAEYIVKFQ